MLDFFQRRLQRRRDRDTQLAVVIEQLRVEMQELRTQVQQTRAEVLPLVTRDREREQRRAIEAEQERREGIAGLLERFLAAKYQQAVLVGQAFDAFALAMRSRLSHAQISRLGGLARARTAFRRNGSVYISNAEAEARLEEAAAREYSRHAPGGRARAAGARREMTTGRFVADASLDDATTAV